VRHFDCGLHDDDIYFAMELVAGGTVKQVLQKRVSLPWHEAAEVAAQICAALGHAHQLGIIHRDLKPGNLFLSDDGQVKVGDFGLARDLAGMRLTLEGTTVGTCRYMPPEQITGDADLTGAVDLYAVGCILFEMLTGHPPFDGETIVEIFEQHLNTTPPRLTTLVAGCPDDLAELVAQLLAKKPTARPASAALVQQALVDILSGRPFRFNGEVDPDASTNDPADELPTDASSVDASTVDFTVGNLTERLHSGPTAHERRVSPVRLALIVVALAAAVVLIVIFTRM
jgi:serine/threonine protein kinase